MAVSLVSPGGNTPSSGGAYYVPAWRFVSYRQQNGGGAPTSASPPPPMVSSGSQPPTFPMTTTSRLPNHLPRDPRLWSREDVHKFLLWCQDEFDLPPVDIDQFQMNGKALCLLMKSDFTERAQRSGDILYNVVHLFALQATVTEESQRQRYDQHLRMCTYSGGSLLPSDAANSPANWTTAWPFISSDYHNVGHVIHHQNFGGLPPTSNSGTVDSTVTLSPAPSTDSQSAGSPGRDHGMDDAVEERVVRRSRHPSDSAGSECGSSPPSTPLSLTTKPKPSPIGESFSCPEPTNLATNVEQPVTNGRLLWDFLHQLLNDPAQRYVRCITWKEQEKGVFKISDPHGLAQLWGMQKNHLNMNFDKMSRALRYYYRVNILKKVQGERHCYQFLRQPLELKACKQRALLGKYCVKPTTSSERKSSPITVKCEGENA